MNVCEACGAIRGSNETVLDTFEKNRRNRFLVSGDTDCLQKDPRNLVSRKWYFL